MGKLLRVLRRYAIPGFMVTIRHYLLARAMVAPSARVQWDERISFGRGTVVKGLAVVQTSGGRIRFGRECAVSSFVHVSTGAGDVLIGDFVRIGSNSALVGGTKDIAPRAALLKDQGEPEARGMTIEDDVLIGSGAVILPGAHIGQGAVVAAGSVVRGVMPAYAIVAGVPAKVIGQRE